jgi:hypothetical protein
LVAAHLTVLLLMIKVIVVLLRGLLLAIIIGVSTSKLLLLLLLMRMMGILGIRSIGGGSTIGTDACACTVPGAIIAIGILVIHVLPTIRDGSSTTRVRRTVSGGSLVHRRATAIHGRSTVVDAAVAIAVELTVELATVLGLGAELRRSIVVRVSRRRRRRWPGTLPLYHAWWSRSVRIIVVQDKRRLAEGRAECFTILSSSTNAALRTKSGLNLEKMMERG